MYHTLKWLELIEKITKIINTLVVKPERKLSKNKQKNVKYIIEKGEGIRTCGVRTQKLTLYHCAIDACALNALSVCQ